MFGRGRRENGRRRPPTTYVGIQHSHYFLTSDRDRTASARSIGWSHRTVRCRGAERNTLSNHTCDAYIRRVRLYFGLCAGSAEMGTL
eukprot:714543-Prymnesium_polylepis.1